MERKFLLYLLYLVLINIRERSYENNDKAIFWQTDLLHNVPLWINTEEEAKETFKRLHDNVESLGMHNWLEEKIQKFYKNFPEYNDN